MAGSQNIGEESDNPVGINVTAMVDVIFCLCIFFMCSFHFKQLEGKFDTWLPKDHGQNNSEINNFSLNEIRVSLDWDAASGTLVRRVGHRPPVASDGELMQTITAMVAEHRTAGESAIPVVLDARSEVPWQDVLHVVDICKLENLNHIEFTAPDQPK